MTLKSMKITKKEFKEVEAVNTFSPPEYPWELRIHLDEDLISKLELSKMPEVGDAMTLIGNADVVSTGESEDAEGGKRRNLTLQITEMSLEKKVSDDTLKKIYGD